MLFSFLRRQQKQNKGICTIYLDEDGLAFVYTPADAVWQVRAHDYIPGVTLDTLEQNLTDLVKRHDVKGAQCALVLAPSDYQLLKIDHINVPDDELKQAAQWRINDLIDYPVAEAAIDIFPLPAHGAGNQRKKLYVVAMRMAKLQQFVESIEHCGLSVKTVDIYELALRNLNALYPQEERGLALFSWCPTGGDIIITKAQHLFFTRHVNGQFSGLLAEQRSEEGELSLENNEQTDLLDYAVLEIRRSYDYYISQLAQVAPQTLLLPPVVQADSPLFQKLSDLLESQIAVLDVNEMLKESMHLTAKQQQQLLPALGGALRFKEAA